MARKKAAHAGGHGWFVTFADLMALLMSFFVMLVAMSSQNKEKMQVVAGSMREAFGTQKERRYDGIIEMNGIPYKPALRNVVVRNFRIDLDRQARMGFIQFSESTCIKINNPNQLGKLTRAHHNRQKSRRA